MDGQQEMTLRQRVEFEIRGILHDEYGLNIEADVPIRYYLDFKTHRRLLDLRDVLERMDQGIFGICLQCGKPISDHRLSNAPLSRLCDLCMPTARSAENAVAVTVPPTGRNLH